MLSKILYSPYPPRAEILSFAKEYEMATSKAISIRVPFTRDNVKKCSCPSCPVQTISQCMIEKIVKPEALKIDAAKLQEIPAVYCSQGQATCTDIDTTKSCICPTCQVFEKYELAKGEPVEYYCRDGKAGRK